MVIGIIFLVKQGETLAEKDMILPLVGVIMLAALIWLSSMAIKSWRTPAGEVFELSPEDSSTVKPPASLKDRIKAFACGLIFLAITHMEGAKPPIIFVVAILLITGLPVIGALIRKAQGREGETFFSKVWFRPEQLIYLLFSLFGTAFSCVWCCLTIIHGAWFMLPFGIAIGALFLRPPVAAIQLLLRNCRGPGEKYVRSKKDKDPWDRPDRDY